MRLIAKYLICAGFTFAYGRALVEEPSQQPLPINASGFHARAHTSRLGAAFLEPVPQLSKPAGLLAKTLRVGGAPSSSTQQSNLSLAISIPRICFIRGFELNVEPLRNGGADRAQRQKPVLCMQLLEELGYRSACAQRQEKTGLISKQALKALARHSLPGISTEADA
jgi:hypothetical protein